MQCHPASRQRKDGLAAQREVQDHKGVISLHLTSAKNTPFESLILCVFSAVTG